MPLDLRPVVTDVINDLGGTVTIINYTAGTFNVYGDSNYTTGTFTVTAVIQTLSQEDTLVQEGEFKDGDIIFYFKSSDGGSITRGDRVLQRNSEYTVDDIIPYEMGEKLYEKASQPKRFLKISGLHNDLSYLNDPEYARTIQEFVGMLSE